LHCFDLLITGNISGPQTNPGKPDAKIEGIRHISIELSLSPDPLTGDSISPWKFDPLKRQSHFRDTGHPSTNQLHQC
jgi:hypothetical protein